MILSNDNTMCNNNDAAAAADDDDDVNNISKCELLVVLPKLDIDYSFDGKLRRLQREYHWVQHQLAYLSTMGGANHLCNKPLVALEIAQRQEFIGKRIGSTSIQIRAKVFQAVNYGLLGNKLIAKRMFNSIIKEANDEGWPSLISFITASMMWLKMEWKAEKQQQQQTLKTICN